MHHAIDGRCGRHRIFEDLIRFREHQVRGDHYALALKAFGKERKEHFHLRPVVLDVADIVERKTLEAVEALQLPGEPQIALGIEEALHETLDWSEEDGMTAFDERSAERRHDVRFARAGLTDEAHVGGSCEELPAQELADLCAQGSREAVQVQRREGLLARQLRLVQKARDAPVGAIIGLERDELSKISNVVPALRGRALAKLTVVLQERGQAQRFQPQFEGLVARDCRGAHAHTASRLAPRRRS